jgi:hypothetical protein
MATIHSALATVKSQYSELVPETMISQACVDVGHHWRQRKLDPAMTVHLLLLQLLARVALISLDQVAHVGVSAVAICRARMRLPLSVWMKLAELVGHACSGDDETPGYCGHTTYLVDGTTFTTPDTPQLAGKYGKASNQKKTKPGFPIPKLLALMNLASGVITKVIDLPHARGEQTVLTRMLRMLSPGDLLLGDRGLVSFAHVALMMRAGIHCLVRLPRGLVVHGRGKGSRKRLKQLGKQDMLVQWKKPPQHKLSWLSKFSWRKLPASLQLRQVAFCLHRKGFRSQWVWIITTLDCPVKYTAQSLAELYGKRWDIEVAFRHLKQTLKMTKLSAKTVDGVKKQILAFVMLYNLVRHLMNQAAKKQGVAPDRISFSDALTALLYLAPNEPMPRLRVNPKRERPSEPRARKHGGYRYPVLRQSRAKLQRPHARVVIRASKPQG